MMYRILETAFLWVVCMALYGQEVKIVVHNTGQQLRHEVVGACVDDVRHHLGVADDVPLIVSGAFGQQVDYQMTQDGLLLLDVSVLPEGEAEFTVKPGTPREPKHYVYGAQYRQRLDDLAWENDRCAYRLYGPALMRKGERSYGIDVWTKNTPELVVAERYRRHFSKGKKVDISFHIDHGDGMDGYAVGPTLGCGAPVLIVNDVMQMPWCYESYKILDNGPLRFTVELTYPKTASGITEHRLIQLDKGSHFNRMTVWYDGLGQPASLAAGVALHGGEPLLTNEYILYADPTEKPAQYQSQIFVGLLFPEGAVTPTKMTNADGKAHAVGVVNGYEGQPITYYFGAAWSMYDVPSIDIWKLYAAQHLQQLKEPLGVKVIKK